MQIKRISPEELSKDLIFRLNYVYHTRLNAFIAMTDRAEETLFVHRKVPQQDIDGFLEVIMFPEYGVADYGTPTGQFLEYVCQVYGFHTYSALLDAHNRRMDQKKKKQAEEIAKAIIPLIEKEVNSKNPVVKPDERVMYEIWKTGYQLGRETPENLTNYGSVYEFYYGYLLGAGVLEGGVV